MYGYISGYSDTDDIKVCPKCGTEIKRFYGDGTAECEECRYHFGVVECEDDYQDVLDAKALLDKMEGKE